MRDLDFVTASKLAGGSDLYIITRHLLPNFASHLIVSMTLAVPGMILGETALSFIGLGMQEPGVSWGVLLDDTKNFGALVHQPWKLIPAVFIIVTILMFNFVGDGLARCRRSLFALICKRGRREPHARAKDIVAPSVCTGEPPATVSVYATSPLHPSMWYGGTLASK